MKHQHEPRSHHITLKTTLAAAACLLSAACAPSVVPLASAASVEVGASSTTIPDAVPQDATSGANRQPPLPVPMQSESQALDPVEVALSQLPVADYPRKLMAGAAPQKLPPGGRDGLKRRPGKLLSNGAMVPSVLEVTAPGLARLQISRVGMFGGTSRRSLVYCGDDIARWRAATPSTSTKPQVVSLPKGRTPRAPKMRHPGITPARWEVLSREGGELVLTVTDAWFDHRSCELAVQSVTEIKPAQVLDEMVYAFRGRCDDCRNKEVVTFVAPSLLAWGRPNRHVAGGEFTLARFPIKQHVSTRFVGLSRRHRLKKWATVITGEKPGGGKPTKRALVALELTWDNKARTHGVGAFGVIAP